MADGAGVAPHPSPSGASRYSSSRAGKPLAAVVLAHQDSRAGSTPHPHEAVRRGADPCAGSPCPEPAWLHTPTVHEDPRGTFREAYRAADFARPPGTPSPSPRPTCPSPGAGCYAESTTPKCRPARRSTYVTCLRGALLDVAVDLRTGSSTYGRWAAVRLDAADRNSLYLAEGSGHAFLALEDDTTVMYLCSEGRTPGREHGVRPLDPGLAADWPGDVPLLLSEKDAAALSLRQAAEAGRLLSHSACLAYADSVRTETY
ncbi:dTDP-4-dehydrorhamnose 3,5-epimerase family protein [Streptomyces sp. NPDC001741]|uniref:dTDP-4-dehydrorhamnose 3,5-epimerase family protein n=1 Tax=Streptomyces sp. NPDC001741 TaxID=3364605 RepID=UPI0036B50BF8